MAILPNGRINGKNKMQTKIVWRRKYQRNTSFEKRFVWNPFNMVDEKDWKQVVFSQVLWAYIREYV